MQEGGIRPGQGEHDGLVVGRGDAGHLLGLAGAQLVMALDHAEIAGAGALGGGIDGALERIFDVGRGDRAAIVEFEVVTELERIGQAGVGDGVFLGEIGLEFGRSRLVVHQPVEDRLDHRPVLPVVTDLRIKGGQVVVEGHHRRSALLWRLAKGQRGGKGRATNRQGGHEQPFHLQISLSSCSKISALYQRNRMRGSISGAIRSARKLPSTMNRAATVVTPMMSGMSSDWIACHMSWPMPGQPKTFSTTTTPDMKMPMSSPIMAMIGSAALRRPWTSRTRRSPMPLARAVRI